MVVQRNTSSGMLWAQWTEAQGKYTDYYERAYDSRGVVTTTSGASQRSFGDTAAYSGDYNELLYLRARFYGPNMGRFVTKDLWPGQANYPLSYNHWIYGNSNPINFVDPSGNFSEGLIQSSLNGLRLTEAFGKKRHNVARWGLYELLRDLNSWDQFTLRIADFQTANLDYPLALDGDGAWTVYEEAGCELVFINSRWGKLSLPEFLRTLNQKAEQYTNYGEDNWWRRSSVEYHWYESNGNFYSDFYEFSVLPQLILTSASPVIKFINEVQVTDMYGNEYEGLGIGLPLAVGYADRWEGYPSYNAALSQRSWRRLSESELENVILGLSISVNATITPTGAGFSFWRVGSIAFYGQNNFSFGLSISLGNTLKVGTKDYIHHWAWVDNIPRYGPPN